jgi:hypothetical protein
MTSMTKTCIECTWTRDFQVGEVRDRFLEKAVFERRYFKLECSNGTKGFHCGISNMYMLYFDQITPLYLNRGF